MYAFGKGKTLFRCNLRDEALSIPYHSIAMELQVPIKSLSHEVRSMSSNADLRTCHGTRCSNYIALLLALFGSLRLKFLQSVRVSRSNTTSV